MSAGSVALPAARSAAVPERDWLPARLAAFAALAAWGAGHWAGMVADPPALRAALAVALATAAAAGLAALRPLKRRLRVALAAPIAIGSLAAGLMAAGLPARLLLPGNLGELLDGLDRGLSGIQGVSWPYAGADHWIRLTLLLGLPLLLSLAAAVVFWPARRGAAARRGAGLVLLLTVYGVAVTEHDPGEPLLRGLVLLLLVAAWLWLPRLGPREVAAGGAAVVAAGVLSLPLAARLDGDAPWWDYRAWNWFGGGKALTFDWSHSYGPLDWPREGATLLQIRSDRAHYWKAETLDRFDGFRWVRSPESAAAATTSELPDRLEREGRSWEPFEFNPRWDERVQVTVRALRSDLLVGPGTTYSVRGVGAVSTTGDGTTRKLDEPLERGASYVARGYAPSPTAAQMRATPAGYAPALGRYTAVFLPRPGETALEGIGRKGDAARSAEPPRRAVFVPLRGDRLSGSSDAERRLLASPYARVYRLTRRLVSSAPTSYDAVKRIERHLRRSYAYNESPPSQEYPLAAFLFEDRIGYCQQFSGAMALMLRMRGIPARVASGFAPGSFNKDTGEYRVRDLDAHSWVEVHFPGIGWVPFDPTPDAAPAESRPTEDAPSAGSALSGGPTGDGSGAGGGDRATDSGAGADGDGGGPAATIAAGLAAALLAAVGAAFALWRRSTGRRAPAGQLAESQLAELRAALERLGWRLPGGTTLLALERRLARAAGPASARYAARLRRHRYAPDAARPPGRDERRALRRELAARGGLRGRLRALVALPPGGPRGV